MTNTFAKEFILKLNGKLNNEDLKLVLQELEIFSNDYDIKGKSTDILSYNDIIPSCYKVYLISKRIEGLSEGTLKIYDLYLRDFFMYIEKPLDIYIIFRNVGIYQIILWMENV